MTPFLFAILAAALFAPPTSVRAAVMLSNLIPTQNLVDTYSGPITSATDRGVTFYTGTGFDVMSVTVSLHDYDTTAGDVAVITFQLGTSTAPSGTVLGTMVAPISNSNNVGNFVFTTSSLILPANTGGQYYWLIIEAAAGDFQWIRSNPAETPPSTAFATFGNQKIDGPETPPDGLSGWRNGNSGAHSFEISGLALAPVPEPRTAILLGLGLTVLVITRRRRTSGSR